MAVQRRLALGAALLITSTAAGWALGAGAVSTSPSLVYPPEGAVLDNGCTSPDTVVWDFDWADASGATQYNVYVIGPGATIPLVDVTVTSSSYRRFELAGYIAEFNRFGWRWKVRAYQNGAWGEFTPERSFDVEPLNTDCPLLAPAPLLIAPFEGAVMDNGCTDFSNRLTWDFDWADVPGATLYHLYVIHPSATFPVVNRSNLTTSSFRDESYSWIGPTYQFGWRWKVRSYVDGAWGNFGAEATFNAETVNSDCSGAPIVTAPASGQTVGVGGVSFGWSQVSGAAGYGLRVTSIPTGQVVFSGSLDGAASTSTLIGLPAGKYLFEVRACAAGFTSCGPYGSTSFRVDLVAPGAKPTVTAPIAGASLTSSTQNISWTFVPPNPALPDMTYEVVLTDVQRGLTALQINVPHPSTSTVFSLGSSSNYRLEVRACQAACGPFSSPVSFSVTLATVPASAPVIVNATVTGNDLNVAWTSVANADLYQIQVIQAGAGPGGGALTVAARQTSSTSITLPVPLGSANILVAACNGDGCGPFSAPYAITPAGSNPAVPNLGTPMAGTVVSGPTVLFTWNRIPTDSGGNTTYRLFVQDLSRQATALDVLTTDNFYAAYFKAEGARYDALVIANPGLSQVVGPAVGFNVSGASSTAPTMVQPAHQSTTMQGNVQLGWSPVPGATLYEYFVAIQGQSNATVRGVTPGLFVQVPLAAVSGQGTVYSGIVRACPSGATCVSGSDAGWGPWSVNAGPGVTNFTVTP